jgi:hypothetical protein
VLKKNTVITAKQEEKAAPKQPEQDQKAGNSASMPERRLSLNVEEIAAKKEVEGSSADDGSMSVRSQIIEEADKIDKDLLNLFPGSPLARRAVQVTRLFGNTFFFFFFSKIFFNVRLRKTRRRKRRG